MNAFNKCLALLTDYLFFTDKPNEMVYVARHAKSGVDKQIKLEVC